MLGLHGQHLSVKVDAYCSLRHYLDHLAPVWLALPEEMRGELIATPEVIAWGQRPGARHPVQALGGFPDRRRRSPVLVAGFTDHHAVRPRPTIMLNHGAGQSYAGDPQARGHEAFSGGPGRERVLLHIEPGALAAKATAAAGRPFVAVGSPKLDPWHDGSCHVDHDSAKIAVGFHHDARGGGPPEQRSALAHYSGILQRLARRFDLIGHGHPRSWDRTAHMWAKLGVRAEPDFARVLDEAAVYVTDTSSTGLEFASTGRPVIFCSAPWYRRDVDHGGRFWEWTRHALHVEEPEELLVTVAQALADPKEAVAKQWPMVDQVYLQRDGQAAQRAAAAIVSLLADRSSVRA